jgi:hypothetical protein
MMTLALTQQNPWLKTRTEQQPQPDDGPNPNTAESMVGNAHRTLSLNPPEFAHS